MDKILICSRCNKEYYVSYGQFANYNARKRKKPSTTCYCSVSCRYPVEKRRILIPCTFCGKDVSIYMSTLNRRKTQSKNIFCNSSCSATFNNCNKAHGYRRSKLEYWLEEQLSKRYPTLVIEYNSKNIIKSELDIFIPSINLAVELNGIFHYEPIHGIDTLNKIQNNDSRKFQACIENGIELCIIDTSSLTYFKPKKALKFLDIITKIIDSKIVQVAGLEPARR